MKRRHFLTCVTACGVSISHGSALALSESNPSDSGFANAEFIKKPELIVPHTQDYEFIGPSVIRLRSGHLLMAANGVESENIKQKAPRSWSSLDGGRTWKQTGRLNMNWKLSGRRYAGGVSFLRLQDGRLAILMHRGVKQGGGLPSISFSSDEEVSWSDACLLGGDEGIWYVMNDRMIQTKTGRILVPVARGGGRYEGDTNSVLCFFSDDGGTSWLQSSSGATLPGPRGMAEPAVAELEDGRILLLGRTGKGAHYRAYSSDNGKTWSSPEPTTLVAACSPLTLKRMPDGRLIVLYNHAQPTEAEGFFPRDPLVYAISSNNGRDWSRPAIIDDEPHRQHIYPSICFLEKEMVVLYSTHFSQGKFGANAEQKLIGGAKCCLLKYPN